MIADSLKLNTSLTILNLGGKCCFSIHYFTGNKIHKSGASKIADLLKLNIDFKQDGQITLLILHIIRGSTLKFL